MGRVNEADRNEVGVQTLLWFETARDIGSWVLRHKQEENKQTLCVIPNVVRGAKMQFVRITENAVALYNLESLSRPTNRRTCTR